MPSGNADARARPAAAGAALGRRRARERARSACCACWRRRSPVRRRRSAGRSARSTSTSRRRARSRSSARSTPPVARAALAPFDPRAVVAVGPADGRAAARGEGARRRAARRSTCASASPAARRSPTRLLWDAYAGAAGLGGPGTGYSHGMSTTELTGAEEVAWDLSDLYASLDDPRIDADVAPIRAPTRPRSATATTARSRRLGAAGLAAAADERQRIDEQLTRPLYYAHLMFSTNMADPARGALSPGSARRRRRSRRSSSSSASSGRPSTTRAPTRSSPTRRSAAGATGSPSSASTGPTSSPSPRRRSSPRSRVSGVLRLVAALRGAGRRAPRRDRRRAGLVRGRDGAPPERRPRGPADDRRGDRRGARARPAHPHVHLQHDPARQVVDDRLRSYPTWITARNLSNETTDEAVQALVDAAVSRYDIPQRYYRLKARLLGLDRIAHYDRFAPLLEDTEKTALGRGAPHRHRGVRQLRARGRRGRPPLLRRGLDRRAGARRQADGGVLRHQRARACTRTSS